MTLKRSDMLDVLQQEFEKYNAPGTREDHKRLAEHVLYTVELMGMPPPLNLPEGVAEELFCYCTWEPEDE
jgi:hypothetical protein